MGESTDANGGGFPSQRSQGAAQPATEPKWAREDFASEDDVKATSAWDFLLSFGDPTYRRRLEWEASGFYKSYPSLRGVAHEAGLDKILNNRREYDSERPWLPWAQIVHRRAILDEIRKFKTRPVTTIEEYNEPAVEMDPGSPNVATALAEVDKLAAAMLATHHPACRRVAVALRLRRDGRTLTQVAFVFQVGAEAVRRYQLYFGTAARTLEYGPRYYSADIPGSPNIEPSDKWSQSAKCSALLAFCVREHLYKHLAILKKVDSVDGYFIDEVLRLRYEDRLHGYELRLAFSPSDVSSIPHKAKKKLVVLAPVDKALNLCIFAGDGKKVVETDLQKNPLRDTRAVEALRAQLTGLGPRHRLTSIEKDLVLCAVASIVGVRQLAELGLIFEAGQSSATLGNKCGTKPEKIAEIIDYGALILLVSHVKAEFPGWFAQILNKHSGWCLVKAVFVDDMTLVDAAKSCGSPFSGKSVEPLRTCFCQQMQQLLDEAQHAAREQLVREFRDDDESRFARLVAEHREELWLLKAFFEDGMTLKDAARNRGGKFAAKSLNELRIDLCREIRQLLEAAHVEVLKKR